jgi:hypothetical protein
MPLPIIAAGLLGVGVTVKNLLDADSSNERANHKRIKALYQMGEAQAQQEAQEEKTNNSLIRLANRKKGVLMTSMQTFLNVYNTIKTIDFKESQGIKELESSNLPAIDTRELQGLIKVASLKLTPAQNVVTLTVGGLEGLVAAGVVGAFFGAVSNSIAKDAELNEKSASMYLRQVHVAVSQAETTCVALDAVCQRSDRFYVLLGKLNLLFTKALNHTQAIIQKNGRRAEAYSREERDALMNCINFAGVIKNILDTPLLDMEGAVTQQSQKALATGEGYLAQLNALT